MLRYFFTNTFGILTSRVLGLVRDLLSANILGASVYSDLFFASFKIPNLFRRIFAEGAFANTFLPFFASSKKRFLFTNYIFYTLFFVVLILCLGVTLFPEVVAHIFVAGFSDELKSQIAPLIAINFYYLLCIFVVATVSALLQYKYHFATSAFSTALLNLAIIGSLLLSQDLPMIDIVYYMSYGVVVGGVAQVIVHFVALRYIGFLHIFTLAPRKVYQKAKSIRGEIQRFNHSFGYSILGQSTAHISAFLDTFLASFLFAGSISYLYYANRIFQLPMGLFSVALGVSIFPILNKLLTAHKKSQAFAQLQNAFFLLLFLLSISCIFGIIFSKEIVWLLFERGAFTREDTLQSASVLASYLVGLVPFGLAKIFTLWLYAQKRHKRVAKLSAYSLGVNIVFSALFAYLFGVWGLALASSVGGVVLFGLVIKEFGMRRFVLLTRHKYMSYFALFFALSITVAYTLKWLIRPYLQL